ncbi:unnamed protein product, partial [Hymenolepis diminuta]
NLRVSYGILQRRADYHSLATQLSNYGDTEVRFSSVARNNFTRINFSKSTKDPKDQVKNVGILYCNSLIGETLQHDLINTATSVYMLPKFLILLFIFNRQNQILLGFHSNLPLRTH